MAMVGDIAYRVPTLRVAQGHALRSTGSTYCYYFTGASEQQVSSHDQDLMVFGNHVPQDQTQEAMEEIAAVGDFMRKAWSNFARTGSPSNDEFEWPQYDSKLQFTLAINAKPQVLAGPFMQQRQVLGRVMTDSWQALGSTYNLEARIKGPENCSSLN